MRFLRQSLRYVQIVLLLAVAASGRAADGALPDEVSIFGLRVYDELTDLGDSWSGIGGRAGWQLFGPLIGEADIWAADAGDRAGASGGLLSAKLLAEGLVTGVYARAGIGRYRGTSAYAVGAGGELYLVKRVVLRGEVLLLRPRGNKDVGFSLGIGFRL